MQNSVCVQSELHAQTWQLGPNVERVHNDSNLLLLYALPYEEDHVLAGQFAPLHSAIPPPDDGGACEQERILMSRDGGGPQWPLPNGGESWEGEQSLFLLRDMSCKSIYCTDVMLVRVSYILQKHTNTIV